MAIAVIGGLISSTLLSLIYVPTFFSIMDDLQGWLMKCFKVNKADDA